MASCNANRAEVCHRNPASFVYVFMSVVISIAISRTCSRKYVQLVSVRVRRNFGHTIRAKGNFRKSKSVDFWYFRISRSATVPGRNRTFLRAPPSLCRPPLARRDSCGAAPVLFLAVAFFRAGERAPADAAGLLAVDEDAPTFPGPFWAVTGITDVYDYEEVVTVKERRRV